MITKKKSFPIFPLILVGIALMGGMLLFVVITPWGISTFPDSAVYIGGARNLLKGLGYRHFSTLAPVTKWPPWYSFSLAATGLFGADPLDGAKFLHVLLFSLNIVMVGIILKTITRSKACALTGAWLMMTSFTMFRIHGLVCSEPWFIFLGLGGIFCLVQYLGSGRSRLLVLAAVLTGLAGLDRYTGITVIAAGTMTILLFHSKSLAFRIKDSLLYLLAAGAPLGLWLMRNHFLAHTMASRTFQPPSFNSKYYLQATDTFSKWVLPGKFPPSVRYWALIAFVVLLTVMLIEVIRKETKKDSLKAFVRDPVLRLTASLFLFVIFYFGLHIFHLTFLRASASANERLYSPLFATFLIIFLAVMSRLEKPPARHVYLKITAALFLGVVVFFYGWRLSYALPRWHKKGDRIASRAWKTSPTLSAVNTLPEEAFIYTNQSAAMYLLTKRVSIQLPRKYSTRRYKDAASAKLRRKLFDRIERVKNKLISEEGYIVFFNRSQGWYDLSKMELEEYIPLVVIHQFADGTIYKINPEVKS